MTGDQREPIAVPIDKVDIPALARWLAAPLYVAIKAGHVTHDSEIKAVVGVACQFLAAEIARHIHAELDRLDTHAASAAGVDGGEDEPVPPTEDPAEAAP